VKKLFLTLFILIFFTKFIEATNINSVHGGTLPSSISSIMSMEINLKKFPYLSKRITLSKFLRGKNFTIDWGDGVVTTDTKKHKYSTKNRYRIKIYADENNKKLGLRGCRNSFNLALSLESIYMNEGVEWASLKDGFSYCGSTDITFKNPNFSSVKNLKGLFSLLYSFKGGDWIKTWDVSNITNMKKMFFLSKEFNQDIGQWNVSNVTNMEKMFYFAKKFNQNLSQWDVSNVTNMRRMFRGNLSTKNYSSTLVGWSKLSLQNDVTLDAQRIKYNLSGGYAKQNIINSYNWTINDAGLDINCTYRTSQDKCIQVEIDESKLNLFLKHEDNEIIQIEHLIYPDFGARIIDVQFLPSENGDYSLFWTPYDHMSDASVTMIRFNSNGVESVPKKRITSLGHAGFNPDITLLKNDNFLLHWCKRGSESILKLFNTQGEQLNIFSHGSVEVMRACRKRRSVPAVIVPLDNGGFNYSFGDYNNTFDSGGNPL